MNRSFAGGVVTVMAVLTTVAAGYALMTAWAMTTTDYDLHIDNIPVAFTDDKTLYLDTQTSGRAFIIYDDHLKIRSEHLTFYDFNESDGHENINYVTEEFCYAVVPAVNLTLDNIQQVDRFEFYAWNGTVGVQCLQYTTRTMRLIVNSTDNATLLIRPVGLTQFYEYKVLVDSNVTAFRAVNAEGYFEYNYTGDWSNHTITFVLSGRITSVPSAFLTIIQTFLFLGVFVVVAKQMIWPLKDRRFKPEEVTRRLVHAAVYIIVGLLFITLTFDFFTGV